MNAHRLVPSALLALALVACSSHAPYADDAMEIDAVSGDAKGYDAPEEVAADPAPVADAGDEMVMAEEEAMPEPPMSAPPTSTATGKLASGPAAAAPAPRRAAGHRAGKSKSRKKGDAARTLSAGSTSVGDWAAPAPIVTEREKDVASNSEQYTDYGVNEMTLTEADAQSTFSIDVDTASYTIARRKLQGGQLPPTASVRVEEFVNYFAYDYVQPTGDAPFAVNMEAAPNPYQPGHHVLRVGVQGRAADLDDRKPVHLTFLVDTSGSMQSPDKMGLAKTSLRQLVSQLDDDDTIALATYAGSVRRVLAPTSAGRQDIIFDAIEGLSAGGSTAMSSGIDLAYEMAAESMVEGHENRVIVLSDGDANVGRTSHEQILNQIKGYAAQGVTLSTIGFGMGNYKDVMMEQLSNKGDGNYYYIDSVNEARKVFGKDLSGTLQVIAKDVKIQVEFDEDAVYAYRLIGYENRDIADRDFRNDEVDAGEIGAGHRVTALYDVVLRDGYRREGELACVRLRNKAPGRDGAASGSAAVEWETVFPVEMVHYEFAEASPSFRLAAGVAFFAELLRGSYYTAELTYGELYALIRDAGDPREQAHQDLLGLIRTAGELSGAPVVAAQ